MAFKYSIRFGGAGTHGLIQAARILAEAAAIYDNKIATESCSYGPEARGSASRAEIIISDEAIDYPKAEKVDCLIALTQEALTKYAKDLKPEGIIIVDSSIPIARGKGDRKIFSAPFAQIAKSESQRLPLINIIALGFFTSLSDIVSQASVRQAILARIPKESEKLYLKAFELGLNLTAETTHGPE
jgi:2-oxoglutarate ferredoxin oxidoreductase subunit gamma